MGLTRQDILKWLREDDPRRLDELWAYADEVRREHVGDEVHLRGLIEFSNHCVRRCAYCGLRVENTSIRRYRLSEAEIMDCVGQAVAFGYGTVVLQSGEDLAMEADWLAGVVRRIKAETPLAVTLSVGERSDEDLRRWRQAGADRYLLRFETSNVELYNRIHPPRPGGPAHRLNMLRTLRVLGYEVGSGVMIGIPGQTYQDLAADIELFRTLSLDMIGVGPYIPHPATPLGREPEKFAAPAGEQVPASEVMTYKVIALTRIVCPAVNIPATTALATLNPAEGRELGLKRGANVIMPNLTPVTCRRDYAIYPGKVCLDETARQCRRCIEQRIESIGRQVGRGRGDSPHHASHQGGRPVLEGG